MPLVVTPLAHLLKEWTKDSKLAVGCVRLYRVLHGSKYCKVEVKLLYNGSKITEYNTVEWKENTVLLYTPVLLHTPSLRTESGWSWSVQHQSMP